MALGKRLIQTGVAACLTETTDIFGDSSGKALYSMDYDASSADRLLDATPSNVDFGVGGQINTGARFNGSSSQISLPTSLVNSQNTFTVSFWAKTQTNTDYSYLFSFGQTVDTDGFGLARASNSAISGGLDGNGLAAKELYLNTGSSFIGANFTIEDDTMYHFAVSYTGTTVKIYVNGNLIQTYTSAQNIPSLAIPASGNNAYIGRYIGTAYNWNGTIDQFRVFHSILSDSQVSTLAAEQACVHTSTTDIVDFPLGTTNLAYYKLDNSGEDSKGTNDLTESNIEYRFGRYGQAAVFNGSSSKIEVSDPVIPVGAASLSFWFNNDNTAGSLAGGETHYILGSGVSSSSKGLTAGFFEQKFFVVVNNGGSSSSLTGTTLFSKTNWNHCVVTWDGTTGSNKLKIYVNGNLEIEGTSSIAASTIGTYTNFAIGGTLSSGFIGGRVDQVRIFGSELSPANVTSLYNEKPETDTSNFKTVLYTGNGATQYISNVGMDLETSGGLVWVKNRSATGNHSLIDSVRGVSKPINSNATNTEQNYPNFTLTSFEKNGFFVTDDSDGLYGFNGPAGSTYGGTTGGYVAWVWKGGGTPVSNSSGMGSQISANDKGFSIVKYTGSGSSGTVKHGLTVDGTATKPDLVIFKGTNTSTDWLILTDVIDGSADYLLFTTDAKNDLASGWLPDTTNLNFASSSALINDLGGTQEVIAYCFANSEYQKIGSYSGVSTGTRTHTTGFKPSFVMIKGTNFSDSWYVFDNRRREDNSRALFWDLDSAEYTLNNSALYVTFVDTGFTTSGALSGIDGSGRTFIYYAVK